MRVPRSGAIAVAAILILGAGACGKSTTASSTTTSNAPAGSGTTAEGSSTTAAPAAGGGTISIQNFAFHPSPAQAKVGGTVTIHNMDTTAHTVTADDGSFDTKDIAASGTATIHVNKAGTITFHCNIHQFMKGSITVSA